MLHPSNAERAVIKIRGLMADRRHHAWQRPGGGLGCRSAPLPLQRRPGDRPVRAAPGGRPSCSVCWPGMAERSSGLGYRRAARDPLPVPPRLSASVSLADTADDGRRPRDVDGADPGARRRLRRGSLDGAPPGCDDPPLRHAVRGVRGRAGHRDVGIPGSGPPLAGRGARRLGYPAVGGGC